jgi:hypothetical protein
MGRCERQSTPRVTGQSSPDEDAAIVLGNWCAENRYGHTPGEIGEPVKSLVPDDLWSAFQPTGWKGGHA